MINATPNNEWFSVHTHTRYSWDDGMPSVIRTVDRAAELGYTVLGKTDHGTLGGTIQFYRACRRRGIEPLVGIEVYLAFDRQVFAERRPQTYHACIIAFSEVGYRNLVRLNNKAYEQFYFKPLIDLADLAQWAEEGLLEGLLMTSGCWFGLLPTALREWHLSSISHVMLSLHNWFDGRFFIEIQNHAISDATHNDEDHARLLHTYAKSLDIPTVLTQDSHYLHLRDQPLHDRFKLLTAKFESDSDDATFPGDGYHMVDTDWMRDHHAPDIFKRGMAGLDQIRRMAHLRIPELDTYALRMPKVWATDPDEEIWHRCEARLDELVEQRRIKRSRYLARLREEIEVITSTGFAGYLLLVASVTTMMAEKHIRFSTRGSAPGSIVCWLLGITGLDPIKWGLSFERFLAPDRVKPPDIDLDVEHERRGEVVEWLEERYYTSHIGTFFQYGVKPDAEATDGVKGSLLIAWKRRQRRTGADPDAPVPQEWRAAMDQIAVYNGKHKDGVPIEPPIKSYGQHPAGLLIHPDAASKAQIPIQLIASSKTMVTAYDQHDVDHLGLVKLDVLGLRTLTALRVMEEVSGVSPADIPFTAPKVYAEIGRNTTGLFQLEGWTATKGVTRMRPTKISDVIAACALFRPAAINSGATEAYMKRRVGTEEIPRRHELITKHTGDTYGVLVYQDQGLNLLKDLGLTALEIEKARNAIKASNANVGNAAIELASLMEIIRSRAEEAGFDFADIRWLSEAMEAFAGYSFNLAHATAYGVLAYHTAWYRHSYPVAFWTGVLRANHDAPAPYADAPAPEDKYLAAARSAGVRIAPPHVNRSGLIYSTDGHRIWRGLSSIKGVGPVAARELVSKAPFTSLDDLARRVTPKAVTGAKDLGKGHSPGACPGVIKALHNADALEGLTREPKE